MAVSENSSSSSNPFKKVLWDAPQKALQIGAMPTKAFIEGLDAKKPLRSAGTGLIKWHKALMYDVPKEITESFVSGMVGIVGSTRSAILGLASKDQKEA